MYEKGFDSQQIAQLRQWCAEAREVVLLSHMNADGDACGSLLAMSLMIEAAGGEVKHVTPILPNGCPKTFEWLPNSNCILNGETERELCEQKMSDADLLVCLDMNTPERIDFLKDALVSARGRKALVDHHHNPSADDFDLIISDPQISSTCELVVWLSRALWGDNSMTQDAARCLYTGLRTDTGGFAFSCNQPSCFEAASLLIAHDIAPAEIHNRIVNTFTVDRMRFYGYALSNCLEIYPAQHTALFAIPIKVQNRFGVGGEEMEGLVNYTLMMSDIEVGVLLREEKERTKVSFRAKYDIDVRLMAQELGGGGHTKAAGATCYMPFDQAIAEVKRLLGIANINPLADASI